MMISFRPIQEADLDFLFEVYASTRQEELAVVPWDAAQKQLFLIQQFQAQHTHYMRYYPNGTFDLILLNGQPIGRLYVEIRPDEIRIIDIALLPAHRRQGFGSQLLQDILLDGQRRGLPVRIHVEHFNPALHLYHRLGFQKIGDNGIYYLMEWIP